MEEDRLLGEDKVNYSNNAAEPNEPNNSKLCIDDVFVQIGENGKYQFLVLVLCGIVSTISGIGAYQAVFTDAQPEHRCKLPMFENDTYEVYSKKQQQLINFYIPIDKASSKYDGCYIYSNITDNNTKSIEKCTSWVYSHDYYDTTIVTEWNLVCENATLKGYFRSIFFMGNMSVILIGMLADRFGRKKIAYLFIIMNTLAFLCMSLSVNLINDPTWKKVLFGFSRFLVGFTVNTFALAAVIVIEIVGPSYRVFANIAMNYFYILGELTVLLVAYLERDYKIFSIYMTIMPCILILFFWMVPESVRYLVSQKRYEEADEIFKRIARSNKKIYSFKSANFDNNQKDDNKKEKKISFTKFFSSRKMIVKMLVSILQWFTQSLVYYGISLNTDILGGNPYLNFFYFSCAEFLSQIASHFILNRYGRKLPYLFNYCLIAFSLITIGFLPASMKWLEIILVLISKFSISFNFSAIYIITGESYPTVIRNTAVSTCSMVARIASSISPLVAMLGETHWKPLPFIIYGSVVAFSGLLFLVFIPETKGLNLPESLDDVYECESKRE